MSNEGLVICEKDGHIASLTINRADKLNALDTATIRELARAVAALVDAPSSEGGPPRAVILTGAGTKAFVAGADIALMSTMSTTAAKTFADAGHALCAQIETSPFPVIAAVNGFALGGGCELALACDFIYASDKAKFGQPEINLGVIPGFGGTQRLARRVGVARARELIYTGDMVGADKALAIGLVNEVVPDADLMTRVREVAAKIASKAPVALAQAKRAILRGALADFLTAANELETQAFSMLFGTLDQKEGMSAFLAKKKPVWKGE